MTRVGFWKVCGRLNGRSGAPGGSGDDGVVVDHEVAVPAQVDVQFHGIGAEFGRPGKGR